MHLDSARRDPSRLKGPIEAAEAFMRGEHQVSASGLDSKESIHQALTDALPGGDHFWPRWIVWTESRESIG